MKPPTRKTTTTSKPTTSKWTSSTSTTVEPVTTPRGWGEWDGKPKPYNGEVHIKIPVPEECVLHVGSGGKTIYLHLGSLQSCGLEPARAKFIEHDLLPQPGGSVNPINLGLELSRAVYCTEYMKNPDLHTGTHVRHTRSASKRLRDFYRRWQCPEP